MKGAQWHFLQATVGKEQEPNVFIEALKSKIVIQFENEEAKSHMSYTWALLQVAKDLFKATSFQGGTMLTAAPFKVLRTGGTCIFDLLGYDAGRHISPSNCLLSGVLARDRRYTPIPTPGKS